MADNSKITKKQLNAAMTKVKAYADSLGGGTGNLSLRDVSEGEIFTLITNTPEYTFGNLILSTQSLEITEGENTSFTVKLDVAPTSSQTVTITKDLENVTINPTSLQFTSDNYNTPQTVAVTTAADSDTDKSYCNIVIDTNTGNKHIILTLNEATSTPQVGFTSITDGLVHSYDFKNLKNEIVEDLTGSTNLTIDTNHFTLNTNYGESMGYLDVSNSLTSADKLFKSVDAQDAYENYTIIVRCEGTVTAPCGVLSVGRIGVDAQLVDWKNNIYGMYESATSAKYNTDSGNGIKAIGIIIDKQNLKEHVIMNGIKASSDAADNTKFDTFKQLEFVNYAPDRNKYKYYEAVVYNRALTSEEVQTVCNDLLNIGGGN